jgi:hypothetical protein
VFGPDDALYYVAINAGAVRKVTPNYPRPKGATPVRLSLVPAFAACTSANRTHGAPLAFGSCAPPSQQSSFLTVGTPDANGAAAGSVGYLRLKVIGGDPSAPPDEADIQLATAITDVRNRPALTDYAGELQVRLAIRVTDLDNPPPAGGSGAATGQDTTFPFTVPCTANADPDVGSTCSVATTADAVNPGVIKEGKRAIWQLGQVEVLDGGPDGLASTSGNTVFARQGVFAP